MRPAGQQGCVPQAAPPYDRPTGVYLAYAIFSAAKSLFRASSKSLFKKPLQRASSKRLFIERLQRASSKSIFKELLQRASSKSLFKEPLFKPLPLCPRT
jgi:hypothetical protein